MSSNIAERPEVVDLIRRALAEDIGSGDATTDAIVEPGTEARAVLFPRQQCVVAGLDVAARVFRELDKSLRIVCRVKDGARVAANQPVMEIEGNARPILTGERVALNFVQRLSGIATLTAEFVTRARGVTILDTRKTTPTLRVLEKYAVQCGGGANHRFGLFDRILIKDNHRALWRRQGGESLAAAVEQARKRYPGLLIEVEVESPNELTDVLRARPDWVLLDNMPIDVMRTCVEMCRGQCRVEASGGVTLDNVAEIAATGVDAISVGALTHSARAVDFSLEWKL